MMNGTEPLSGLDNLIPPIRRMRDFHLYDFNGRRYLDLYLDGGRALLGHKPGRCVLMMKNAMEKGLSAPYPGVWNARLLKQLRSVYPFIYGCSLIYAGGSETFPQVRPFDNDGTISQLPESEAFELLLPLPGSGIARLICAAKPAVEKLPAAAPVPAWLVSGLARAAAELAAFRQKFDPDVWAAFDSPLWERRGPWLYSTLDSGRYKELFDAFLKCGILISPEPKIPSCAAYLFTSGEIKPIKEIEGAFC